MDPQAILDVAVDRALAVLNGALAGFEAPLVSHAELKARFTQLLGATDEETYTALSALYVKDFGQQAFDDMNAGG